MYFEKKISTCNVCYSDEARTLSSTEAAVHVSALAKSLVAVRKIPRLRLQQSLRCFTFISVVSNTCIVFQSHSRERAWTENIASCVGPLILHVLTFNSETSFGWLKFANIELFWIIGMLHKISGVIVNNLIKIRLSSASHLVRCVWLGSDCFVRWFYWC